MQLALAEKRLAVTHLAMVRGIARDMKRRLGHWVDLEDLESHGVEGLLHASRRYRPEGGASFATFARHRVRGAMLDAIPVMARLPRSGDDGVEEQVTTDDTGESEALASETRARVRRALDSLPQREQQFLKVIYFEGRGAAHAGAELGLSRSWASRLHARAVERLRKILAEEETGS